jgi:DNA-binding beta-propeller fold protein YncE
MLRTALLVGAVIVLNGSLDPVPRFEVDPLWPKPLPNHWILGSVTGVAVDAQDHVWLVHRGLASLTARTEAGLGTNPPTAETCCAPAPAVLEFDPAGNLVGHWDASGTGFEWPKDPSGIEIDRQGNVSIRGEAQVLKFTRTGAFITQEAITPRVPAETCMRPANDGLVYVCDRKNNRVQALKDGKPLKEAFIARTTGGDGAVWDIAYSADPQQRFVYVADGTNQTVWILRRDTLDVVSRIGSPGRYPGMFYGVDSVAVDSNGNLYTGETFEGKRVQKFLYKGTR